MLAIAKRVFLMHGLALTAAGVVVGLILPAALGRAISSLLFGIAPMDGDVQSGVVAERRVLAPPRHPHNSQGLATRASLTRLRADS